MVIVLLAIGFSLVSGSIMVTDRIRVHQPQRCQAPAPWTGASAPAWALEELQFLRDAERLLAQPGRHLGVCSGETLPRRTSVAA